MKVAVDIYIKVNKFSQTMFSWDMPKSKWAYDMRIE